MDNHRYYNDAMDAVRTNIWYELKRADIRIPFPIRTIQIDRPGRGMADPNTAVVEALQRQGIFGCLSHAQLLRLAENGQRKRYGRRERIIEQGADGDSMFVLIDGDAEVLIRSSDGHSANVATLRGGECFGEMSLLTGEKRSATVVARTDCVVFEIEKDNLGALIQDHPEVMQRMGDLLAQRRMETEVVILAESQKPEEMEAKRQEYAESILEKLSSYFGL
jgi:CRP-like cAMP-binding protein